jgi:hypothetical protein
VKAALGSLVTLAVVAVVVVLGIQVLQEATEYHGGAGGQEQTTVVFSLREKNFRHGDDFAASTLWRGCVSTIGWNTENDPVAQGEPATRTYHAELHPSLPADTRRRLRGCLEDLVVNHIQGKVVTMTSGPATDAGT